MAENTQQGVGPTLEQAIRDAHQKLQKPSGGGDALRRSKVVAFGAEDGGFTGTLAFWVEVVAEAKL